MEQIYNIVPLSACRLMLFAGHNELGQRALCAPGDKPEGEGWCECPAVTMDSRGNELGYLWTRKLARDGDRLIVAVDHEEEDTQPVRVPVDIVA